MSYETKNDETQNTCIVDFRGGTKKRGVSWFLSWFAGYLTRGGGGLEKFHFDHKWGFQKM